MNSNKSTLRWKNIIVVDDFKNELLNIEVGDSSKLKDRTKPRKKTSNLLKPIIINKKVINNIPIEQNKHKLKLTANTIIYSRQFTPFLIDLKNNETNKNIKENEDINSGDNFEINGLQIMDKEQADLLFTPEYEKVNKYYLF